MWRSRVELSQVDGGLTSFQLRLTREEHRRILAPASFRVWRPRIVAQLVADGATSGGLSLTCRPTRLDVDDVPAFVRDVLEAPGRTLPVFIAALPPGYDEPLVDCDRLADTLAGLAHVYVLGGHLAWRRLCEEVGDERSVPRGGARLYWPTAARVSHDRFWTRSRLEHDGARASDRVFQMLTRLSVRVPGDPVLEELRQRAADEQRKRASEGDVETLWAMLDESEQDRERERARAAALEAALAEREWRIDELENELEAQKRQWALLGRTGGQETPSAEELGDIEAPTTWDEFAAVADRLETDALRLTDNAKRMLRDNPYPDPSRMWQALIKLREAAEAWRARQGSVRERLKEWVHREFEIEIALQDKRLRGKVDVEYDGRTYAAEPHVKVDDHKTPDKCGRIYFAIDDDNLRFIVDHIGLHR
jgi:hypothetical protein